MPVQPEETIAALPCWSGVPNIVALGGGLSNRSFKVTDAAGAYVARLGQDFPFHHVSRRREAEASRAAHAIGLAPRVAYASEGVLVLDFIEGRTLTASDLGARSVQLATLLKCLHAELGRQIRGEAAAFWVFHVIRDYIDALRRQGVDIDAARLLSRTDELEAAQCAMPIVFGHHDLLPANLIDDGQRLWLIDWEYAGFGTPMFDLANLADNAAFDPEQEQLLLSQYFGRPPEPDLCRAFAAMKVASALREALWAMVSQIHLDAPGADYAAYAQASSPGSNLAAYAVLHGSPNDCLAFACPDRRHRRRHHRLPDGLPFSARPQGRCDRAGTEPIDLRFDLARRGTGWPVAQFRLDHTGAEIFGGPLSPARSGDRPGDGSR